MSEEKIIEFKRRPQPPAAEPLAAPVAAFGEYAAPDELAYAGKDDKPAVGEVAPAAAAPASRQKTRRGKRGAGGQSRLNPLQRLEGFFEGVFEGSFTRLFHSKLQPAELASRLERAMEDGQSLSVGKVFVPNSYDVHLHPEDYANFASFKASVEYELSDYVKRTAGERSYRLTTPPFVRLIEDARVGRRDVQIATRIVDPRVDPQGAAEIEGEIERTRMMRVPPRYSQAARQATLTVLSGRQQDQQFTLERGDSTLGRGLDNTVVLEDARISRHHATIRWQAGHYSLHDNRSTNGTFLNDIQITEAQLSVGDRVSLGGFELLFQLS